MTYRDVARERDGRARRAGRGGEAGRVVEHVPIGPHVGGVLRGHFRCEDQVLLRGTGPAAVFPVSGKHGDAEDHAAHLVGRLEGLAVLA